MPSSNIYYTLLSSLPHLPPDFDVERTPITAIRLEQRLRMLEPEDAEVVEQVQNFLMWDRQQRDRTDEEVIRHYERLMTTIRNPLVRRLIAFRMDVRTIMSGLRRRRRNLPPPTGVGQWVGHIRRHWSHPDFNLSLRHPWISEVERFLDEGDTLQVERQVLGATWNHWTRLSEQYYFSFEAVILYLARWEIVNRWTRLDVDRGRQRFEQLITETLGESAHLYN